MAGLAACLTHWRLRWTAGRASGEAILWIGPLGLVFAKD